MVDEPLDESLLEIDGVPTWLETPVTEVPSTSPPVQSRPQVLPLNELSWEHFERLSLRYVRSRASVIMTQLYGVRGQKQDGIDLYVRLADPARYEVYQCKRLAVFEANDIKNAVGKFLKGKWRDKAKAFRIMTSHPIEDTKIADAIVSAQTQLSKHDIEFEILGKEQISTWLKDQPRIVDDFFSRGWVEAFCGPDTLSTLKKRLNAETVARYRIRLKRFYEILFNRYDPGIPVRTVIGDKELPLKERFVLPEIFGSLTNGNREQKAEALLKSSADVEGKEQKLSPTVAIAGLRTRFGVDRWIGQSQRSVILGGPGSGKSALLRTLAVELLSEEPVFQQATLRWGTMLPVWIPFSFWTNLNTKRDSPISLSACLYVWFKQFDQGEIWPLVEAAIDDERLLLLVDGLDEWTDETAARTTSTLLQTFIQLRNLPAVLVSRPHGFERVSVQGADWQVGQLAPLSGNQQRELISKWLTIHRMRTPENSSQQTGAPQSENDVRERETEEFIRKLERSSDLVQLAEVPLTLLLLLYLHLQNTPLPANRFDAYEHVVKHFIQEHPLARKTAAASTSDASALTHEEIRHALAYIAYIVQTKFPAGVLTVDDIRDSLESFLRDDVEYGLGLSRQEALEVLRAFTNVEEGSLGLLVSQGQSQISFFHRSLQEYMAAIHLARTPLSNQVTTIQANLADARWREVIVGLVFLCQRGEDATVLVDGIDLLETDTVGSLSKEDILAEIAFKDSNLPLARVRTLVSRAFGIIETSFISSQRSRALAHAMSGLHSRKNKSIIQNRLKRWIFSRGLWGPGRIEGLSSWPATDHTWDTLFLELHDEDGAVIRESATVLARLFGSDKGRGNAIASMALRSENPYQRAASVEALAKGWPEHELLNAVLENGRKCNSEEVQVATILSKVHLGKQIDKDFNQLLSLACNRFNTSIQNAWQGEIANVFASGWAGDPRLKRECFKGIHNFRHMELMDHETAQFALIKAFPQDDDVADFIVRELQKQYAFNTSRREVWPLLPLSFRDHTKVVAALDQWASAASYRDVIALHFGSLVGRTPTMKKRLFQAIEEFNPFWAIDSLLNGWGMTDVEVAERLNERAARADAAEFAQHIPAILRDPKAARERLLTLLRDPQSHRIDFLMQGFSRLIDQGDVKEIVQATLDRFSDPRVKANYAGSLILAFPNDPQVKALARENMHSQAAFVGAIVEGAASDEQLRIEVAELITPVSTDLRYQIVLDLPIFADQTFALELLRDWDSERNVEVKTQASIQYHTLIKESGRDIEQATSDLQSVLPSYGPDHQERRQAAGAGLIVLKQLNTIVGKIERIGDTGKQINIAVSDGFRQNQVFVNLLAKNWHYVKSVIGEQWEILTDRTGSGELWERLATVAAEHPELTKDILEKVDSDLTLGRSASVLTLLSRTDPRSERVVSACMSVLAAKENWDHWYDSVEAASDILAGQFRGDPEIEKRIVTIASEDSVPTSVIMSLSLGWRENSLLKQLEFDHDPQDVRASELYTKYAVVSATEMPPIVEADLAWTRHNKYQVTMMTKPLLARLRFDPEAATQCFAHLKTSTNSSVKASFPKLLAATGEMTAERADWCRQELERQRSLRSPEFGYDALSRVPSSVIVCLLESLGEVPSASTGVSTDI
jgi:energy-coupling factor transporter ATP-binding protein EcfA2